MAVAKAAKPEETWAMQAFRRFGNYSLFRGSDWGQWVIFLCLFAVLLSLDHFVLNRSDSTPSITQAAIHTFFYIACAGIFALWIYWGKGEQAALLWISGYTLEWMLSFDNLFVFHLIFKMYATPDHLKRRPLYVGVWGAIIFRLAFLAVGEYLMHMFYFVHFIFGSFLVYTGLRAVLVDDGDQHDPPESVVVHFLQGFMPVVPVYDSRGWFFVRVPLDEQNRLVLPAESGDERSRAGGAYAQCRTVDFKAAGAAQVPGGKTRVCATMLAFVVGCLEVSDLLFAVDSAGAVVAQVPDLFLAFTSVVFAMLGLRATFFFIDKAASSSSVLKYGMAVVLCLVGARLCLSRVRRTTDAYLAALSLGCAFAEAIYSMVTTTAKTHKSQDHFRIGDRKSSRANPNGDSAEQKPADQGHVQDEVQQK